MTSGRLQKDGSLVYPHRGDPPNIPDGFMRDPGDPYVLIPVFEDCTHRHLIKVELPCGKEAARHWCTLHDKEATPTVCDFCPDIDEPESVEEETEE